MNRRPSLRQKMSEKNKLSLSVQYPDARLMEVISRAQVRRWVRAALFVAAELNVRFVDDIEARALNRDYRDKDYATNVLTFAYNEGNEDEVMQADIVLCTDVLQREAAEQSKSLVAHTAHLVVHGVLHAQGYDHENESEASEMEDLEINILAALGMPNPYANT